jgi:N-acetylneuraminate synthase
LSDHTLGIGVSIAAIALGAKVIEKHLTLQRSDGGADSAFSMEPSEFKSLVTEGRAAAESLGSGEWRIQASEAESRRLRRSLYIVGDVEKDEIVTRNNVRAIRPGAGMSPEYILDVIGKRFNSNYKKGTPLLSSMVTKE